jgi:hypothetical protein
MEASQNKCDVTIQFLVGGLVVHSAGIFHLSGSVQKLFKNFMLVQSLKFFHFWGAHLTLKIFFANLDTPKGTSLKKCASIEALWFRRLFPFGLYGSRRIKKG